jgi:hypothetical protein
LTEEKWRAMTAKQRRVKALEKKDYILPSKTVIRYQMQQGVCLPGGVTVLRINSRYLQDSALSSIFRV